MDVFLIIFGGSLLVLLLSAPALRYEKRTGKKLGRGGALAGIQVINELFQPSAANAAIIIEEQKEARAPMPSPEAKEFDRALSDYVNAREAKNAPDF